MRAALDSLETPPRVTFICGANRFVGAAARILTGLGLPAAAIRTERYGGTEEEAGA